MKYSLKKVTGGVALSFLLGSAVMAADPMADAAAADGAPVVARVAPADRIQTVDQAEIDAFKQKAQNALNKRFGFYELQFEELPGLMDEAATNQELLPTLIDVLLTTVVCTGTSPMVTVQHHLIKAAFAGNDVFKNVPEANRRLYLEGVAKSTFSPKDAQVGLLVDASNEAGVFKNASAAERRACLEWIADHGEDSFANDAKFELISAAIDKYGAFKEAEDEERRACLKKYRTTLEFYIQQGAISNKNVQELMESQ